MINVEKLKRHIFDLAIKGKLSSQNKNESAAELIKEISLKKQQLIRSGELKKEKVLPPIKKEDIPFEIPANWVWIRLGDYSQKVTDQVASGSFKALRDNVVSLKEPDYALMVKTADFSNGFTKNLTYTNKHGYEFLSNSNLFGGELILSNIGSIGKVFIVPNLDTKMTLAPNSVMIRLTDDSLRMYLYYFLLSNQGFKELDDISTGSTMKKINKGDLKTILIPVPPKEEQLRIVSKLNEIVSCLDIIDDSQNKLVILKEKLSSKILELATKGKLVEQKPDEGNAKELLREVISRKNDEIKNGLIRKDKPLSDIEEDEVPYSIPSIWKWCRFGDLISLTSGVDLKSSEYYPVAKNNSIPYITGASSIDDNDEIIINRFTDESNANSDRGDILLTCKGTIGKISYNNFGKIHLARQLMGIKTFIDYDYTVLFLKYIVDDIQNKANGLIPGIDRGTVRNYLIPLPPLGEQKRIVQRINELLELCKLVA